MFGLCCRQQVVDGIKALSMQKLPKNKKESEAP